MRKIFVTGIGTGVGKTILSAALVEALKADYWKPIQAGNLKNTDTSIVKKLVINKISQFHQEAYRLKWSLSPHAAAFKEGIEIKLSDIKLPKTDNTLIIEGAGGLMVPLNKKHLVIDLIKKFDAEVVLVSKNYLGSINHTLLSIEALKKNKIKILGIIFNGDSIQSTEDYILKYSGLACLGKVPELKKINKSEIKKLKLTFS